MNKKLVIILSLIPLFWILPLDDVYASPMVDELFNNQNSESENIGDEQVNETEDAEQIISSSPNLFLQILQLIVALAIVIGLIYFLLRVIGNKNKLFQKVRVMENLGGIALGSNKSLQVVRIGEHFYVVGVGENVELLTEITDQDTINDLLNEENTSEFKPTNFLNSILNRNKSKDQSINPSKEESSNQFPKLFESELNKMIQGRKRLKDRFNHKEDDNHE